MAAGARVDPYFGYRFLVELDSLVVAGFSEVSGLEVRLETEDYQEGGVNTHTRKLPKRVASPNVTLRRGLTDSTALWKWIDAARNREIQRRNGRIILLDSTGRETWGWEFVDAYPVRWSGPDLRGDGNAVAVETLELTHEGLTKVDGLP